MMTKHFILWSIADLGPSWKAWKMHLFDLRFPRPSGLGMSPVACGSSAGWMAEFGGASLDGFCRTTKPKMPHEARSHTQAAENAQHASELKYAVTKPVLWVAPFKGVS